MSSKDVLKINSKKKNLTLNTNFELKKNRLFISYMSESEKKWREINVII